MIGQPATPARDDRKHHHKLGQEREPDDPIAHGPDRGPRLAHVGPLEDQHREDEQGGEDQPRLKPLGDALAARVHPLGASPTAPEVLPRSFWGPYRPPCRSPAGLGGTTRRRLAV